MTRTSLIAGAALAAASLVSIAPAQAGTAWSVSIGGPGYAIAAGPPYHPYHPHYRHYHPHWHHAYVPAPVIYRSPVVVVPRMVYRAPVVYAPAAVYPAPRVVYSARW